MIKRRRQRTERNQLRRDPLEGSKALRDRMASKPLLSALDHYVFYPVTEPSTPRFAAEINQLQRARSLPLCSSFCRHTVVSPFSTPALQTAIPLTGTGIISLRDGYIF